MSIKRKRLREKTQKKNCNKINCEMKNRNQKLIEKDNYIFRKKQILDLILVFYFYIQIDVKKAEITVLIFNFEFDGSFYSYEENEL